MGMLAVGAGAADGLKEFLIQELRKQQVEQEEQRIQESVRHNQASEGLQNRQLEENSKLRLSAQAATESERKRVEDNRLRDDTRASLDDVMGGAPVSIATRDQAVKTGAALPERFKEVIPFDRDFMGPVNDTGPQRGEVGSYTLADNPKKVGDTSNQVHTVLYKGKPIDANYDPKTKTYSYKGVDVTADVDHYEKPPAPDRVLIQSGDGYVRRTDAAGKLANGEEVPLATPAATRTRQDLAERVSSHFDDIQHMLDEASDKGLLGPLAGRTYADFLAGKVGSTGDKEADDLLGDLRMNMSLVRSGLGQLHGRGGANVGIVQALEKKMDEGHMSYEELTGALRGMKGWVDSYATKKGHGQAEGSSNRVYYDADGNLIKK